MTTSSLNGKTIAVLATDGCEQVELTQPVEALRAAGATVEIVAPKAGEIQGFRHNDKGDKTAVDRTLGEPVLTRRGLPGEMKDAQSRYIEAAVAGVLVGCMYLPYGNPCPGPKFDYKLTWFERLRAHARTLPDSGAPVVLAGIYNVVPTERDIYNSRSWRTNALLQPESRAAYSELVDHGWTDALLERFPKQPPWTFWQYFRQAWERNAGCASTTCSSAPRWHPALETPALIARSAVSIALAITPPHGSRSISRPSEGDQKRTPWASGPSPSVSSRTPRRSSSIPALKRMSPSRSRASPSRISWARFDQA